MLDSKNEDTIVINGIGLGYKISRAVITDDVKFKLEKTAKRLQLDLNQALLDIDFFTLLNDNVFNSLSDLFVENAFGLAIDQRSTFEIRKGTKKLRNINSSDLISEKTLFPIYNVQQKVLLNDNKNQLFLVQQIFGCIYQFIIQTKHFNLNDLVFDLLEWNNQSGQYYIIQKLYYDSIKINFKRKDYMIMSQHVIY